MMDTERRTDPLEVAIHVIVILVGMLLVVGAFIARDDFAQSLLMNLGSSLVVVTIVFGIFEIFRRKRQELPSPKSGEAESSKAKEYAELLRSDQSTWPISSGSKLGK
jgi:hypothetical protein